MSQHLHDTTMQVLSATVSAGRASRAPSVRGRWPRYHCATGIFAGASEIRRNIIPQRVLGLPR